MSTDENPCLMSVSRMHLFFDDELSTMEAEEIRIHVESCDGCTDAYDVEQAVRALMQRACAEAAPSSLMARLAGLHCTEHPRNA